MYFKIQKATEIFKKFSYKGNIYVIDKKSQETSKFQNP